MKNKKFFRQCEKGMTMLEVVVSMLIIGIGLAMTVSMLSASNRYANSAEYRAIAMREIQSIVDNMRANKLGASGYTNSPDSSVDCGGCDANQKKAKTDAFDLAIKRAKKEKDEWNKELETNLPSGTGTVARKGAAADSYTVSVTWHLATEEEQTLSVDFAL